MVTDPNFGKKQFPSKGGLDGSDNIPFKKPKLDICLI